MTVSELLTAGFPVVAALSYLRMAWVKFQGRDLALRIGALGIVVVMCSAATLRVLQLLGYLSFMEYFRLTRPMVIPIWSVHIYVAWQLARYGMERNDLINEAERMKREGSVDGGGRDSP